MNGGAFVHDERACPDIAAYRRTGLDLDAASSVDIAFDAPGDDDVDGCHVTDHSATCADDQFSHAVRGSFDASVHTYGTIGLDVPANGQTVIHHRQAGRSASRCPNAKEIHCQPSRL
jgi:hypothetical protein